MGTASGIIKALNSGIKHIATKRFTFRYPEQKLKFVGDGYQYDPCLLYTSPSPRDKRQSRMPSSA